MENLNKVLDSNEFIKNIKRMFIMKVIEEHNIEKVNIIFNSNTKSFEIKILKDENINFFKYKVKRRRSKSEINKNKKLKNYEESDNDPSKSKDDSSMNNSNKSKDNIENKEDMNINNSKNNKDNNDIDSNNTKYNIKNKENKTVNNIDINTNSNKNTEIDTLNKNVPNNKYEIIKNCSKLLKYIQMYVKLVGRIHYILINNTPKKAMIELNKIINELEKLKDIPDDLDKINNRLIDITNNIL